MNTTIPQKTSRFLLPLAVAAAIIGGGLVGTLGTSSDADAALKWREEVTSDHVQDNNKDGLKHVDPTFLP